MLTADGKLPVYNVSEKGLTALNCSTDEVPSIVLTVPYCLLLQEEVVRQAVQQINSHQNGMQQVIK